MAAIVLVAKRAASEQRDFFRFLFGHKRKVLLGESHDKRPCRKVGRAGQAQTINLYFRRAKRFRLLCVVHQKLGPGHHGAAKFFPQGIGGAVQLFLFVQPGGVGK